MSEPQQPYGPPPGYGVPSSAGTPAAWGSAPGSPSGYGAPADAGLQGGPQETEAKAVVALVLAVLAYTPVVPFLGAIAALVLAGMAERDIDRSGGRKTGRGLVKAARILSWLHLVFVALAAVVIVLVFLLPLGLSASG